ncbi:MAG: phosphonate transport system ATP-binding protein [Chloroflexia bacterium]|jgi:phosphonate transport system ATP-binding protein|nr:phosphonate transport system ATP-binding protein [Chloroflexia bacterium]
MLRIEGVSKIYEDGTKALHKVDLQIPDGQFVVIIGLSGSGKSTLLRCINGLIKPSTGKIWLDNDEITAASPTQLRRLRLKIGMIFQQFNLVRRSSVMTNVLSGRLGYRATLPSLFHRFTAADYQMAFRNLERVGIPQKAYSRADMLSGGQQQRVAIARALMQEPKLMLADEPVASLDPATSHSVMKYLEQINKEDGLTVLCNLHFLSLARRYADRVIALRNDGEGGHIVFDGPALEIDEKKFRDIYGEDAVEVEIGPERGRLEEATSAATLTSAGGGRF